VHDELNARNKNELLKLPNSTQFFLYTTLQTRQCRTCMTLWMTGLLCRWCR